VTYYELVDFSFDQRQGRSLLRKYFTTTCLTWALGSVFLNGLGPTLGILLRLEWGVFCSCSKHLYACRIPASLIPTTLFSCRLRLCDRLHPRRRLKGLSASSFKDTKLDTAINDQSQISRMVLNPNRMLQNSNIQRSNSVHSISLWASLPKLRCRLRITSSSRFYRIFDPSLHNGEGISPAVLCTDGPR